MLAAPATPAKRSAPDPVGRVLDGVDRLSDWGAWASVLCIVGILVLIVGEVAARNILNKSIDFAWEFSSFLMGAAFMLGAAYSLRTGAQIRVMAVLDNVPPRARHALDLFATLCAAIAVAYLTCALAQLAWLSFTRGSRSDKSSELPLWIAQAPLALGAALLTLAVAGAARAPAARRAGRGCAAAGRAGRGRRGVVTVALTWLLTLLTVTLLAGIWIGPALIGIGVVMLEMFTSRPTMRLIGVWSYNVLTTSEIVSLPMFILMGELLFRTRLSQSLFSGVAPWVGFLPGRLLHTTILGCSLFSAISGSSAATTQVVGRITLTELLRRGYDKGIAVGSLAGGGMLGFLIPPSIVMIIYAVLAEESLLRLFTASFLPGFIVAGGFMAYIAVCALLKPEIVPEHDRRVSDWTRADRLRSLVELGPVAFLIFMVLGTMYLGVASPSEAAAIGVVGSADRRRLAAHARLALACAKRASARCRPPA